MVSRGGAGSDLEEERKEIQERSINYFNSRSMADYGRMAHVGNPEIMGVQREQYQ